jgi:hypothetical protein
MGSVILGKGFGLFGFWMLVFSGGWAVYPDF